MQTTIDALETLLPKQAVSELMTTYGNPFDVLLNTEDTEWKLLPGCGNRGLEKMKALRQIILDFQTRDTIKLASAGNPKRVFELMKDMQYFDVEHVKVLYLNTKNQVISIQDIFKGTLNASLIAAREIFSTAVKVKAAVIVVHNHPSGDPTPSAEDIKATKKLVAAGKVLDIPLLDHVVIGHNKYYSFSQHDEL